MAPSLSTRPLFIRPICEIQRVHEERNQHELKKKEHLTALSINCGPEEGEPCEEDKQLIGSSTCSTCSSSSKNAEVSDDIEDWIDKSQQDELEECLFTSVDIRHKSGEENEELDSTSDEGVLWLDNLDDDDNDAIEQLQVNDSSQLNQQKLTNQQNTPSPNKEQNYECRKKLLQSAISSYLQQSIPLENIVSSCQKIRIDGTAERNGNKVYPSLEVDMIVCSDDESNHGSEHSEEGDNSNDSLDMDPKDAKIFLIRMVNQIPLLDGAEAHACGIVQGITRNRSMWNSFGLEVNPLNRSTTSSSQPTHSTNSNIFTNDKYSSSHYLFMPTFSLRDSANVAPYFVQNTHGLFEDDESSCSSEGDSYLGTMQKRKKKKKISLLPAGLRLGKILIIVQLDANPQELPLPTLSKVSLLMDFLLMYNSQNN